MGEFMATPKHARGETHDVSLGNRGERSHNTLVLPGVDLVVPLERDLDGDPLQNDEVHLVADDGSLDRRLTVDDPAVRDDGDGLLRYEFRGVPFGVYHVSVRVGGELIEVMHGLEVRRRGVFHEGARVDGGGASLDVSQDPLDADDAPRDEDPGDFERFEHLPDDGRRAS